MRIVAKGDIEMRKIWEAQQPGVREARQALRKGQEVMVDKFGKKAQSKALEVMPEELKVLYVKTLAAQSSSVGIQIRGRSRTSTCLCPR